MCSMHDYKPLSSNLCESTFLKKALYRLSLVFLVMVLYALTSCGGEDAPPPPAAAPHGSEEGQEQSAQKEKKPSKEKEKDKDKRAKRARLATSPVPTEEYNIRGERDPFRPTLMPRRVQPLQIAVPLTPLQSYDADSLRIVGIIWGEMGKRALVQAPDGKAYFVTAGTLVGKNMGQVVEINSSSVIIEEKIVDIFGKETLKRVTMELKREKEEG